MNLGGYLRGGEDCGCWTCKVWREEQLWNFSHSFLLKLNAVLSWEWWESRMEGVKRIGWTSGSSVALLQSNSLDSCSFVACFWGCFWNPCHFLSSGKRILEQTLFCFSGCLSNAVLASFFLMFSFNWVPWVTWRVFLTEGLGREVLEAQWAFSAYTFSYFLTINSASAQQSPNGWSFLQQ